MPRPPEGFNPPPVEENKSPESEQAGPSPDLTDYKEKLSRLERESLDKTRQDLFGQRSEELARERIKEEGRTSFWKYFSRGGRTAEQRYRQEYQQKGNEILTPEQQRGLAWAELVMRKVRNISEEDRIVREKMVKGDIWDKIPILKSALIGEAGGMAGAFAGVGVASVLRGSLRYALGPVLGGAIGGAVFEGVKEKYRAYKTGGWLKDAGLWREGQEKQGGRPLTLEEISNMPTDELMRAGAVLGTALERNEMRGSKMEFIHLLGLYGQVNDELFGRKSDQESRPGRVQKLAERDLAKEPLTDKEAAELRATALLDRLKLHEQTSSPDFEKKIRAGIKEEYRPYYDQLSKARGKQVIAAALKGAGKGALIGGLLGALLHHGPSGEQIVAEWKASTAGQAAMENHEVASSAAIESRFIEQGQGATLPGTEAGVRHLEHIIAKGGEWEGMPTGSGGAFEKFVSGVTSGSIPRGGLIDLANVHNIDLYNVTIDNQRAIDFILEHKEAFAKLTPDLQKELLSHPATLAKALLVRLSDPVPKIIAGSLGLAGLAGGYLGARWLEQKAERQRQDAVAAERQRDEASRTITVGAHRRRLTQAEEEAYEENEEHERATRKTRKAKEVAEQEKRTKAEARTKERQRRLGLVKVGQVYRFHEDKDFAGRETWKEYEIRAIAEDPQAKKPGELYALLVAKDGTEKLVLLERLLDKRVAAWAGPAREAARSKTTKVELSPEKIDEYVGTFRKFEPDTPIKEIYAFRDRLVKEGVLRPHHDKRGWYIATDPAYKPILDASISALKRIKKK